MARLDSPIKLWLAGPNAAGHFKPDAQSDLDRQRWRQIRSERRRLDWMVSRALLARVAPPSGHTVSLSHSNGHAAAAVAPPGVQMGVDLEFTCPRDVLSLARLAFSSRECKDLKLLSNRERVRHFYTLWTLKEALAKALQVDLQRTLKECEILDNPDGWQVRCAFDTPWSAQVFAPGETLILSIVRVGQVEATANVGAPVQHNWPPSGLSPWNCIARLRHEPASSRNRSDSITDIRLAQATDGAV